MFQLTRSSLWVGLLGVAGLVPLLIFALWGGAVADAVDRRLLLASTLVMWSATLGLLVQALLRVGSPVLLLAIGGAADLVSAIYRQTILQTYAPDELQGRMQGVFIAVVAGGPGWVTCAPAGRPLRSAPPGPGSVEASPPRCSPVCWQSSSRCSCDTGRTDSIGSPHDD